MANLTLRAVKGSPLTNAEMDGNFEYFTGSHAITGSLIVTGGITGSVQGIISSSYAVTASYIQNAQSASYVLNAQSASYVLNAVSASHATTSSYALTAQTLLGSIQSASYALTASNSSTASYVAGGSVDGVVALATNALSSIEVYTAKVNADGDYKVLFTDNVNLDDNSNLYKDTNSTFLYNPGLNKLTVGALSASAGITGSLLADNIIVSGSILVSGSIVPNVPVGSSTSSFNLGSPTAAWKDIYVSNGTINFLDNTGAIVQTMGTGNNQLTGYTIISGSLAQGQSVSASGLYSHAEGLSTIASGSYSHAEGYITIARGPYSHAEGYRTTASGEYSHAEGQNAIAVSDSSHAEGYFSTAGLPAWNTNSTVNGTTQLPSSIGNVTSSLPPGTVVALGANYLIVSRSFFQANLTQVQYVSASTLSLGGGLALAILDADNPSKVYPNQTLKAGYASHAEGSSNIAVFGHAEGYGNIAFGSYSHAEGIGTIAVADGQHTSGRYNRTSSNPDDLFIIGNGDDNSNRKDILLVSTSSLVVSGSILVSGSIVPNVPVGSTTSSFNLGSPTAAWKDIYVSNGTINFLNSNGTIAQTIGTGNNQLTGDTFIDGKLSQGQSVSASGLYSHAEGTGSRANGIASHAEGFNTIAGGFLSGINANHAEGIQTTASGRYSHAEGQLSYALGESSHAEGYNTFTNGTAPGSHAEGYYTRTDGAYAHAEGSGSSAWSNFSHAEGIKTYTYDYTAQTSTTGQPAIGSHAEGELTITVGRASHAEGKESYASGSWSHTEGYQSFTSGQYSHAEGVNTFASGEGSHAEGYGTYAGGLFNTVYGAHAEGSASIASGNYSHAEGQNSIAAGNYSHAEGSSTTSNGLASHAEGVASQATGEYSHAEGIGTLASNTGSHSEGVITVASGPGSHAEGGFGNTPGGTASGPGSHAEGTGTLASNTGSHAEGYTTIASGQSAHAEGENTVALGYASHAEGNYTIASGSFQHVQGQYNTQGDTTSLMIVGNGTGTGARRDAFKVRMSGSIILPTTQSSIPAWSGSNGEMVFATVSGANLFYVWMGSQWRSGSLA